jgi:hypothetical protein
MGASSIKSYLEVSRIYFSGDPLTAKQKYTPVLRFLYIQYKEREDLPKQTLLFRCVADVYMILYYKQMISPIGPWFQL